MARRPDSSDLDRSADLMAELGVPGIVGETEVGRGGFGTVYRGLEEELGRAVAVKVLPAGLKQRDRDRFDRERKAMGSLSGHPNIVTVHRTGFTADGRPYIVMEYLERGSMDDRLQREGAVPWDEAVRIGVALAGAVHTAHMAGVLHRDIKPGNVLISSRGETKLADFGIARLEGAPETSSSIITASVAHAGPEIIDGRRPSAGSDLYSLASTIYTLIAGHPPFSDPSDQSIVPLLARIARDPLPAIDAGVPAPVWAALVRAMAKDPSERPATVEDFGLELAAALELVTGADPTSRPPLETRVVAPPPPMDPIGAEPIESESPVAGRAVGGAQPNGAGLAGEPQRPDPPLRNGRSTSPWLIGAGVVLVTAIVAVGAWGLLAGERSAALPVDTGDDFGGYVTAFDASGAIQLLLPATWVDTDLGGSALRATIAAAPDLEVALNTYDAPGALITVNPETMVDADAALDQLVDPTGCRALGRADYADGVFTGRFEQLVDCGDAGADVWVIVAAPADGSFTLVVSLQALEPRDETAGRRILDTLTVEPRAVPGS